jgi:hypothetical protein
MISDINIANLNKVQKTELLIFFIKAERHVLICVFIFFLLFLKTPTICAKSINFLYPFAGYFTPKVAFVYRIYLLICATLYYTKQHEKIFTAAYSFHYFNVGVWPGF